MSRSVFKFDVDMCGLYVCETVYVRVYLCVCRVCMCVHACVYVCV